jgi:ammonia channel protein AmtB
VAAFGAALVYFMQAGFAMVETGMTRAKNAGNIVMKNMMDFACGTPAYWLIGYGIMYGAMKSAFRRIDLFCMGQRREQYDGQCADMGACGIQYDVLCNICNNRFRCYG